MAVDRNQNAMALFPHCWAGTRETATDQTVCVAHCLPARATAQEYQCLINVPTHRYCSVCSGAFRVFVSVAVVCFVVSEYLSVVVVCSLDRTAAFLKGGFFLNTLW